MGSDRFGRCTRRARRSPPVGVGQGEVEDAKFSAIGEASLTASATAWSRTTSYEHDEAGNITRIVDPLGGETLQTFDALGLDYTRSPSGEPTRIDREDGSYVLYDYDGSLRLTGEHYRDAAGGIVRNITYVYDADGNRTQRITQVGPGASSTVEDYTYSAGDLLETISVAGTTTTDYDYDTAGRVTTIADGSPQTLAWDADDHVTAITEGPRTVTWTFDGDGRRLSRTEEVSGLVDREVGYAIAPTLSESLESPHAVTDGSGNEQAGYVFAGEHPLFRYDPVTGEPTYYLQDGMGSVIGLVGDDAASEQSTIHYDGFGNELAVAGTLASLPSEAAGDFRFQGMWLDQGTGLYYVRARVYEAGTGRFLSRDPAEGMREEAETYWAYAFAASSPTVASDPTGRNFDLASIVTSLGGRSVGLNLQIARGLAVAGIVAAACATQYTMTLASGSGSGGPCSAEPTGYNILNGVHRAVAAREIGRTAINAEVTPGAVVRVVALELLWSPHQSIPRDQQYITALGFVGSGNYQPILVTPRGAAHVGGTPLPSVRLTRAR